MAWHEQRYWLTHLADETPKPILNEVAASGGPRTTPSLTAMLKAWEVVTTASDPHLDALYEAAMLRSLPGPPPRQTGPPSFASPRWVCRSSSCWCLLIPRTVLACAA